MPDPKNEQAKTEEEPYKPSTFADEDKVDNKTGQPWHLAIHNPELRVGIRKGDVRPVEKDKYKPSSQGDKAS